MKDRLKSWKSTTLGLIVLLFFGVMAYKKKITISESMLGLTGLYGLYHKKQDK